MPHFKDPAAVAREVEAIEKVLYVVDGFFLWEFISTLDYEWDVIQRRLRNKWAIALYCLARVATLVMVGINLYYLNATTSTPMNCQLTMVSQFVLAYLALASSSLLIVLRIIAIWDNDKIIVGIATGTWGTNIVFLVQGVWRFRAALGDEYCVGSDLTSIRLSTIVALVTDIILLSIMLVGLSRVRRRSGGGAMPLVRLLWNQGIIWVIVAVVAEVTPVVFICLDLDGPFNLAFQVPWVIAMTIAATRMYRSLSEFLSSNL